MASFQKRACNLSRGKIFAMALSPDAICDLPEWSAYEEVKGDSSNPIHDEVKTPLVRSLIEFLTKFQSHNNDLLRLYAALHSNPINYTDTISFSQTM